MNNMDFFCMSNSTYLLPSTSAIVLMRLTSGATTDVAIWSVVELGIGLIIISLPSCRALVRSIPFFAAAMSSEGSDPMANNQRSRTRDTWADKRTTKKATNPSNDVESFTEGNSNADLINYLTTSSSSRDAEKAGTKQVVMENSSVE
jgi:hypothetical protein